LCLGIRISGYVHMNISHCLARPLRLAHLLTDAKMIAATA